MHVIPVRGCVDGVVGPALKRLTFLRDGACVSGTPWDGRPEWVRVPYAKTHVVVLGGVPE